MDEYDITSDDRTKWDVFEQKFYTASGYRERIAAFETKKQAEDWLRWEYGKKWRSRYSVERA